MGVADRLLNMVHYELVAHCPEEQTESVKSEIEKCILDAANQVLGPWGIPAEVDVKVSKRWGK